MTPQDEVKLGRRMTDKITIGEAILFAFGWGILLGWLLCAMHLK